MNQEYIKNIKTKLYNKYNNIGTSGANGFHSELMRFWEFLVGQSIFADMIQELELKPNTVQERVKQILDFNGASRPIYFELEEENIVVSYMILENCISSEEIGIERRIIYPYKRDNDRNVQLEAFKDIFIYPLYNYLNDNLDDSRFILTLLNKYKQKCEWFQRKPLYNTWKNDTQRGEYDLALNFYEYLFDQGIEFSIEPRSISGEADLVSALATNESLIADTKIFNKEKGKTYIINAFRQIYQYTLDYNEPLGFLVIYKTCEEDLKLPFENETQRTPFVQHNNKTIFFVVIDIFPYEKSASKRGKLKFIEITENELWSDLT